MQSEAERMADVVVQTIKRSLAPVHARLAVAESQIEAHTKQWNDMAAVRERVAVLEVSKSLVVPSGKSAESLAAELAEGLKSALQNRRDGIDGKDGRDGKDAPLPDLDVLAAKAAALIPPPRDGRDGEKGEKGQDGQDGKIGPAGVNGKDAPPVDLAELAIKAAQLVPVPTNGRDGKDAPVIDVDAIVAKSAEPLRERLSAAERAHEALFSAHMKNGTVIEGLQDQVMSLKALVNERPDVEAMVKSAVDVAVKALPVPKDGTPGEPGRDGRDVDAALLQTIVAASVERVLAEWPKPKDGASLTPEDVAPLIKAEVAAVTADIRSGSDGVGIVAALIDQDGNLQLTKSDGSTQSCGRVVGAPGRDADMDALQKQLADEIARFPRPKDGQDGAPGADGLGFEDLDGVLDDEKGFTLRFARNGHVKEFGVPVVLDRGVYRPGVLYVKGSAVTAYGSLWIAQMNTSERPGESSKAWRLAVKRGRDGKDALPRNGDA